jgi:transposase-like protein
MEEARVEALKRRVQQERELSSGRRRPRFSKALKQEVVALLNTRGWGHRRVSKALGLSESSIHRWAEKLSPRGKNGRQTTTSFKRVAVVDAKATKSQHAESSDGSLCLELAGGARVTGLTLSQVAELLRGQS